MSISAEQFLEATIALSDEARELRGEHIPVFDKPPTALEFARVVKAGGPAIIKNALSHMPALTLWTNEYLARTLGDAPLTVAVTPDGRADSVRHTEDGQAVFALPHEETMTFSTFLSLLASSSSSSSDSLVYYLQTQNDNLSSEFSPLARDVDEHIDWATEALGGKKPEAVNFWAGDSRSVTSSHRDHYENLFGVIRGEKIFTLYAPTDAYFFHDDTPYPIARWEPRISSDPPTRRSDLRLTMCASDPPTPWIPVDPLLPASHPRNVPFPRFQHARRAARIRLKAGEMLYLPSGWLHHVEQRGDKWEEREGRGASSPTDEGMCVSVNWWYEAEVGERWAWLGFLRELGQRIRESVDERGES